MSEYTTESGLVVHDYRHARRDWDPDPRRAWESNPNVDPPPPDRPGVGPNMSEGFGNEHVMFPGENVEQHRSPWRPPPGWGGGIMGPNVMPWSGWPVEWATPNWNTEDDVGLGAILTKISLVFGCIDLNSSLLSTMPPYRLQGDEVVDELPWMLNPQPEVYTSWSEAMREVIMSFWTGEAFLWATSRYADTGQVRTWVMLNPAWVEVELDGQYRRYWMGRPSDGAPEITDDVLHLRYASWPGRTRGIGPLEVLATTLFGVEALEYYQSTLATRGGIPWGVLSAPGNLTEPQATEMRERFVAARLSSVGAPAVLSGGVSLSPFTLSPKDMALLELRQFDEARIAVLLGVPPTLMALPTGDNSMTYRNAEAIYDFHWRAYLRPKAQRIMEAISQWALPRGQRVEVNRDEYVRPNFLDRMRAYDVAFKMQDELTGERVMSIDEIRDAERLVHRDEEDEDEVLTPAAIQLMIAAGLPHEMIWEKMGFDEDEIEHIAELAAEQREAEAEAQALSFGQLNPYPPEEEPPPEEEQ